jgi:hypothetical protein
VIEPLASKIRNDPKIKEISIPSLIEKLVIKLFTDNTSIYLSKSDDFQNVQKMLEEWCEILGVKFNKEKQRSYQSEK